MKEFLLLFIFTLTPFLSSGQNIALQNSYEDIFIPRILGLEFTPSDPGYGYALSQDGKIFRVLLDEENPQSEEFLDLSAQLSNAQGERGLLGLAFHPNYPDDARIFVNYTAPDPLRTVVSAWSVDTNANVVNPNSEEILLEINQPFSNHNGGHIAFGPEGFLYIGTGDGGSGGDPQNNAQNTNNLLGAILRIDVNVPNGYGVPQDNPFVGAPNGRDEIFAWGLRNPWRFSFDMETGDLWLADVGQNAWESIYNVEKGKNYGWRILEGSHCFDPPNDCDTSGLELPIFEYDHSDGDVSITGGYVSRDPHNLALEGKYIYADYVSGRIWALSVDSTSGEVIDNKELLNSQHFISSFAQGLDGTLYVLTHGGGRMLTLLASPAAPIFQPTSDTLILTDTVRWEEQTVDRWQVEVARDSQFTDLVYSFDGPSSAFWPVDHLEGEDEGWYFMRVKGHNEAGEGPFSRVLHFYLSTASTASGNPEIAQSELVVFPNPSSGQIQVDWPGEFQVDHFAIYSADGRLVHAESMEDASLVGMRLDLSPLPKGSYILMVMGQDGERLQEFFVLQ